MVNTSGKVVPVATSMKSMLNWRPHQSQAYTERHPRPASIRALRLSRKSSALKYRMIVWCAPLLIKLVRLRSAASCWDMAATASANAAAAALLAVLGVSSS